MSKKLYIISLIIFLSLFGLGRNSQAATYSEGDLLALENTPQATVYYIGADGKKYAFPDDKTYFTWYDDFSSVVRVNLSILDQYPDGGAVPYRAGARLVTHPNTAKVYAVSPGGKLHWIPSEEIARNLYGDNWVLMVQDLISGYFSTTYVLDTDLSNTLPDGTLVKLKDSPDYYYIEQGKKRKFSNEEVLRLNNFRVRNVLELENLEDYQDGQEVSDKEDCLAYLETTLNHCPINDDQGDNDEDDNDSDNGDQGNDQGGGNSGGGGDNGGGSQGNGGNDTIDNDSDNDGYDSTVSGGDDCDDSSASIHPGATEICSDGIDQDCSGADLICPSSDEPEISGLSDDTLDDGQSFVIYGSGFGVNNSQPSYWDNFEDGQAEGLDLTSNPGMYDPDVSNVEQHDGNYSLRTRLGDPDVDVEYSALRNGYATYWFPEDMTGGDKVFLSFWERWDWGDWYCADGGQADTSYQIKNFRVASGNHAVDPPDIPQNNQSDCNDWGNPDDFFPRNYVTDVNQGTEWFSRDFEPEHALMHEKWHLFEVQIQQSHNDQTDGSYELWITREGQTRKVADWQNDMTHQTGDHGFNQFVFGNWIDALGRSTTLYFDDMYINFSWRRVAIGNNADYYQSTRRELVPYTAWSDNSITATANLTAFEPSDQLYLFVFDEEGLPSTGIRVYTN